jgi:hypothetical protein
MLKLGQLHELVKANHDAASVLMINTIAGQCGVAALVTKLRVVPKYFVLKSLLVVVRRMDATIEQLTIFVWENEVEGLV